MFWAKCPYCAERLMSTCSWCRKRQEARLEAPPPIDYTQVEPETIAVPLYPRLTHQPQRATHLRLAAKDGRRLL